MTVEVPFGQGRLPWQQQELHPHSSPMVVICYLGNNYLTIPFLVIENNLLICFVVVVVIVVVSSPSVIWT